MSQPQPERERRAMSDREPPHVAPSPVDEPELSLNPARRMIMISTAPSELAGASRYAPQHDLPPRTAMTRTLCLDRRIGRDVVLARPEPGTQQQADFVTMARLQAQLEHPSVLPIYDIADDEVGSYYTCKHARGLTLAQVLDALRERQPAAEASFTHHKLLSAFAGVCMAVDFAHARGVAHGGLHPTNVLLGAFGEVSVLGWEHCKLIDKREPEISSMAAVLGKMTPGALDLSKAPGAEWATRQGNLGTLAPERLLGQDAAPTPAGDGYSLGAILFEILTLQPLHAHDEPMRMKVATLKGANAQARQRAPERDVHPALEAICVKATAMAPQRRFDSVRALHDAVQAHLEQHLADERRRASADAHAEAAREALGSGAELPLEPSTGAYETATRELRSALALDPGHPAAMQLLVQMLVAAPEEQPAEVAAALKNQRSHDREALLHGASAAHALMVALALGFALALGLRRPFVLVAIVALLIGITLMLRFGRLTNNPRRVWLVAGAIVLLVAACTTVAGPLLIVPPVASAYATMLIIALRADSRHRLLIIGGLFAAFLVPLGLQMLGVIDGSYVFTGTEVLLRPGLLQLGEPLTLIALATLCCGVLLLPAVMLGRWVDALARAEQEQLVAAWQLRQLLPDTIDEDGN